SKTHISEIVKCYLELSEMEEEGEQKLASKGIDNADFGYYKINIERPKRLKAQFTKEKIEVLQWDKAQAEFSNYLFETYAMEVYSGVEKHKKAIADYIDKYELNINAKQLTAFLKKETWQKQEELYQTAVRLMEVLGTDEFTNFNSFTAKVD